MSPQLSRELDGAVMQALVNEWERKIHRVRSMFQDVDHGIPLDGEHLKILLVTSYILLLHNMSS